MWEAEAVKRKGDVREREGEGVEPEAKRINPAMLVKDRGRRDDETD